MSKVTGKLQVTLPKSIAERFNIKPGDQIEWEAAGRDYQSRCRAEANEIHDLASRPAETFRPSNGKTAATGKDSRPYVARCFCSDRAGMDPGQSLRQ
jgi:AbrB family looped-hinge helix DNA binding protein